MKSKLKKILSSFRVLGHQYERAFSRKGVAAYYLKGEGIEIGALHNPLKTTSRAKIKYIDRLPIEGLQDQYPKLSGSSMVKPDILDNGETLGRIPDDSLDFIIANHFLEHTQNPIMTILNFFRKVKPGGIVYLAVPDMRFTFDCNRPVTSLSHLLKDYEEGPEWSRRSHFEEWVKLVDNVVQERKVEDRASRLMKKNYSIHFHAWTQTELYELLIALKKQFCQDFDIELSLKSKEEIIFILRKPVDKW